jgi:hypothetical protein
MRRIDELLKPGAEKKLAELRASSQTLDSVRTSQFVVDINQLRRGLPETNTLRQLKAAHHEWRLEAPEKVYPEWQKVTEPLLASGSAAAI